MHLSYHFRLAREPGRLTIGMGAVRSLREELQLLQEPGSHVGEVVKVRKFEYVVMN